MLPHRCPGRRTSSDPLRRTAQDRPPVAVAHPRRPARSRRSLRRVMIVSPTAARVPSCRSISRSASMRPSRMSSVRARWFEGSDCLVRVADEHGRPAGAGVRAPSQVRGIRHRLGVALAHPVVREVPVDRFRIAAAQAEGCRLLPLVHEAVHVDEFWCIPPVVDEQGERTARVDRLQLSRVPDEQHLCSCLRGERGDAIERKGAGQGCFVDDHELSGPRMSSPCALVVVPPFREVLGRDAEIFREDVCGGGRWREADDGCSAVILFPGVAEGVHRGRLARTGRADEHVDDPARCRDPRRVPRVGRRRALPRLAVACVRPRATAVGVSAWCQSRRRRGRAAAIRRRAARSR